MSSSEAGVQIGDRTRSARWCCPGNDRHRADNVIYTGATMGFPPQYLGFSGAPTRLVIGAAHVIREYASIHRGLNDESATTIGTTFHHGFLPRRP